MSQTEAEVQVQIHDGVQQTHIKIEDEAIVELIDLYCDIRAKLDPKLAQIKIEEKELTEAGEALQKALDANYDAEAEVTKATTKWLLAATAKGKVFTVSDKKKLIEIIGLEAFLEMADMKITDVKKYLTPIQLKEVGSDVYKNARRLTYAAAPK